MSAVGSKSIYTLEPGQSVVSAAFAAFAVSTYDMKSSHIACLRIMLTWTTYGSISLSVLATSPLSLKDPSEDDSISTVEAEASLGSGEMVIDIMQAKERQCDLDAAAIWAKGILTRIPSTSSVGSKTARRFRRCRKITPVGGSPNRIK